MVLIWYSRILSQIGYVKWVYLVSVFRKILLQENGIVTREEVGVLEIPSVVFSFCVFTNV